MITVIVPQNSSASPLAEEGSVTNDLQRGNIYMGDASSGKALIGITGEVHMQTHQWQQVLQTTRLGYRCTLKSVQGFKVIVEI